MLEEGTLEERKEDERRFKGMSAVFGPCWPCPSALSYQAAGYKLILRWILKRIWPTCAKSAPVKLLPGRGGKETTGGDEARCKLVERSHEPEISQ